MIKKSMLTLVQPTGEDLRFTASFPMRPSISLDAGGEGHGDPGPMDLILAALGACTGMDVIGMLRKQRQDVTAYEVLVTGDRRTEHPRIYTSIDVTHRVRGRGLNLAGVRRAVELSDTKYCSVHAMLEGGVTLRSRIELIAEESPAPTG
jgi:putative redox protein